MVWISGAYVVMSVSTSDHCYIVSLERSRSSSIVAWLKDVLLESTPDMPPAHVAEPGPNWQLSIASVSSADNLL